MGTLPIFEPGFDCLTENVNMGETDYAGLCLQFSNRSNPKLQLEASNQLYSLLWSKQTNLQTVLDNLLIYGINSSNEEISSGAIRHLPIILLKHFKDADLDLTRLIRSLLEKDNADAINLFQNLENFLGHSIFKHQKEEAERQLDIQNATVRNYSTKQMDLSIQIEKLLISLMPANIDNR